MSLFQLLVRTGLLVLSFAHTAAAKDCDAVGRENFTNGRIKTIGYVCGSSIHFLKDLTGDTRECCHCKSVRSYLRGHGQPLACSDYPDFSATLNGVLVSPRGSIPLPYQALSLSIPGRTLTVTTDAKGEFHVSVPDLKWENSGVNALHLQSHKTLFGSVKALPGTEHEFSTRLEIDITLVQGLVLDKATRAPLAGVTVTFPGPDGKALKTVTDQHGSYQIQDVKQSQINGTIRAKHSQFASEDTTTLRLDETSPISRQKDLFLSVPSIAGQVTLHSIFGDEKLKDVVVRSQSHFVSAQTDETGGFLLPIPDRQMIGKKLQIDSKVFPLPLDEVDGLNQTVLVRSESADVTPGHDFKLEYSALHYQREIGKLEQRLAQIEEVRQQIRLKIPEKIREYGNDIIAPDVLAKLMTERLDKKQVQRNWGFVIDTSGSMYGHPIDTMVQMLSLVIDLAHPKDTISIALMPSYSSVILSVKTIVHSRNKAELQNFITKRGNGAADYSSAGIKHLASRVGDLDELIVFGDSGSSAVSTTDEVRARLNPKTKFSAYCLNCAHARDVPLWQELASTTGGVYKEVATGGLDIRRGQKAFESLMADIRKLEGVDDAETLQIHKRIQQIQQHLHGR